ncbi:beta-lactamase-like protein [Xylariaceae sp. AK1471]|nr:beta-lactamase-like protein [Xylariaceae sp. AK1471]
MSFSQLDIPYSTSTVSVSIIDTTARVTNYPFNSFAGPAINGFSNFTFGSNSFLISHGEQNLLFDLGIGKELETDYPPSFWEMVGPLLEAGQITANVDKYVSEILTDENIPLDSIDAIIWSHSHFDHTGRPSLFPNSTDLIVGTGFLEAFGQGYPVTESSPFLAREMEGRNVREINFAPNSTRIGDLQSYDYFGDGSFYLLDAPGHDFGHMAGLARLTLDPDTFILLGADSFHHAVEIRPSHQLPLPKSICLGEVIESLPNPIPRKLLQAIHPASHPDLLPPYAQNLTSTTESPFQAIIDPPVGVTPPAIPQLARDVLTKVQAFDADPNVFVVAAHDLTLQGTVEFFPATANNWKAKGWKEKIRWQFVKDLVPALELVQK